MGIRWQTCSHHIWQSQHFDSDIFLNQLLRLSAEAKAY
jgi:hypothetical protein